METKKPFTFDRVVRICIGCAVAVALFLLLKKLSSVLLPFFIAWLLAYFIHPLVIFFQEKCRLKNRGISIMAAFLSIIGVGILLVLILTPFVSKEMARVTVLVNNYQSVASSDIIPAEWQPYLIEIYDNLDFEKIFSFETVYKALQKILPTFWSLVSGTFSLLFGLVTIALVFIYFIFILIDYEKISDGWVKFIPSKQRALASEVVQDLQTGMSRYFRRQAVIAACVGVLFAIGFQIVGLPLGIIVGLFVGALNMVPYLQVVGFIPVTLLALLETTEKGTSFWWMMAAILAVFAVVQIIQDGFLVPKIMGKATGLNPAVILLSLSIWGSLLGIVGMIIALPITSLIISYYKRFVLCEQLQEVTTEPPV